MENYQFITLIGLLAGGFAWMITWLRSIDGRLNSLENRVTALEVKITVLETRMGFLERILEMMGLPFKLPKERTDP